MASNSSQQEDPDKLKKSIEKPDQNIEAQKDQLTENLDSELDFWSMDSDNKQIEQVSDELEDFLTVPAAGSTKSLSELAETSIELEDLGGEEIIKSLEKANSRGQDTATNTLSEKDIEAYKAQGAEEQETVINQLREKRKFNKQRNLTEKICTALCALFLIGLGVFYFNYVADHIDIKTEDEWVTNIPVEGEFANITSISTWWAEPVDKVKLGIKLVPTATITLGENSKSGVLRVIFFSSEEGLNGNRRAKGDPVPLVIKDGKFHNGKNSITIQCTDGFSSIAEFNAYRHQNLRPEEAHEPEKRWNVTIKEASSIHTSTSDYKELGHAPIEPLRSELRSEKSAKN